MKEAEVGWLLRLWEKEEERACVHVSGGGKETKGAEGGGRQET